MNSQNSLKNNATTKNTQTTKNLSELSALSGLPNGWKWVKLGDILESLELGKRPKGGVKNISYGIPSIGGEHLSSDGTFDFSNIRYVPEDFAESMNRGWIKYEDIIVVKDGATTAKTSFVSKNFPFKKAVINEHVFICRVKKEINSKWVFFNLWSEEGRKKILLDFRGAAQGGISSNFINKVYIPLPPIAEQKKIVEKIEELFSQLDSGVAALKKAKEQIRLYRQSVLAAAFSGKLTTKDTQTTKNLSELSALSGLPSGWKWVKLGDVCHKITDGTHFTPTYTTSGVPFISVKDIYEDKIHFDNCKFISRTEHNKLIKRCKPELGDVLITKSGTIGRIAIVRNKKEFSLFVSVALLKPNLDLIDSNFLGLALKNYINNIDISQTIKGGLLKNYHIEDIKETAIPLPPFDEQKKIVSEIEKRFSEADNLEKAIDESLAKAETLRQSILKQAFEGKLV